MPNIPETYAIIDATTNLRDNTMLLMLFQSGIRENAICHLKFGHVKDQVYPEPKIPLRLRITDQIDTKLRGYMIDYYDTFLQGEAVQKLRAYCDAYHKDLDLEKPLFYTDLGNPMSGERIWEIVKGCVRRAGLNPATIWVHTIRRAFKRVVRHSSLDDDFKEAIMGHVLEGSRENYFSRNDPQEIATEYMKIEFGREVPESKVQKQAQEIEKLKTDLNNIQPQVKMLMNMMQLIYQGKAKPAVLKDHEDVAVWRVKDKDAVEKLGIKPEVLAEAKEKLKQMQKGQNHKSE